MRALPPRVPPADESAGRKPTEFVNGVRVSDLQRYVNQLVLARKRCERRIEALGGPRPWVRKKGRRAGRCCSRAPTPSLRFDQQPAGTIERLGGGATQAADGNSSKEEAQRRLASMTLSKARGAASG